MAARRSSRAAPKPIAEAVVARLREAGLKVLTTARKTTAELRAADLFIAADVATAEGCAIVPDPVRDRLGGVDRIIHVVGGSSVWRRQAERSNSKRWT
jgi:nucleoside-diphosphate-sugar epimerase